MAKINQYIKLSKIASSVVEIYEEPTKFCINYFELDLNEQQSYINHFIVNNSPYAFKHIPLLYEQITQFLADELNLNCSEIKLIGSAKTGFSISPKPNYGNPFTSKSDLDFSIINETLFKDLKTEFILWSDLYKNGNLIPKDAEKTFWNANLDSVPNNLKRGFIDTYKIPNRNEFKLTQKINNSLYLITFKLNEFHKIKNSKSSVRVYENFETFYRQLKLNTEYVLNKI